MDHPHHHGHPTGAAAVLDIGGDVGALVVHANEAMLGSMIEVSPSDGGARVHVDVLARWAGGRRHFAAVFPGLAAGAYTLWRDGADDASTVTVRGGEVAEVDWRH